MKQSPLKNKPTNIKAPKLISKIKSPGKALTVKATTASSNLPPSAALTIDSTASKSSLTKRITLPCTSSTMDVIEPLTPLAPVTVQPSPCSASTGSLIPVAPIVTATATAPMTRSVWYLGGNQIIKLLTSVDGDLDHAVLANIADVPSVVGDLALSVESLVSDDFTVGGFETDLLAKIAANTLAAKRASVLSPASVQPQQEQEPSDMTIQVTDLHHEQQHNEHQPTLPSEDPMTITSDEPELSEQQLMTFDSVPNPLADYQPVPNPLARITPPPSPLITIDNKPTEVAIPPTAAQMIQAR